VLSFLALHLANRDKLPEWDVRAICKLLGEAEWYVGTHGGANDQTTILRNHANGVLYNRHSLTDPDSTPLPFLKGVRVVLANSLWEANKSLTAGNTFNLRKGWMDLGDDLMKLIISEIRTARQSSQNRDDGWITELVKVKLGYKPDRKPRLLASDDRMWQAIEQRYCRFGSLDGHILGIPEAAVEELIALLPEGISPEDASRLLGKDVHELERDYTLPGDDSCLYRVRAAATFFHNENRIGRRLEEIFVEADRRLTSGELSEDSAQYDGYRLEVGHLVESLQETLRDDFQVSNSQLDMLLHIARLGPGYLGGKLTGAGSGGCVSILVRQGYESQYCDYLDREYYGKSEHFDSYRRTIGELERGSIPGTPHHAAADEMRRNLEAALSSIQDQRRAVTFSRGACVLELPG
jgi:galactokinase